MAFRLEDIDMGNQPITMPTITPKFHLELSPRGVRTIFGGAPLADSKHALLLREVSRLPVYYFPLSDVRADALERTDHTTTSDLKGVANLLDGARR